MRKHVLCAAVFAVLAVPSAVMAEGMSFNESALSLAMGGAEVVGAANSNGGSGFSGLEFQSGVVRKEGDTALLGFYGYLGVTPVAINPANTNMKFNLYSLGLGTHASLAMVDTLVNKGQLAWPAAVDKVYVGGTFGLPLLASQAVLAPSGSNKMTFSYRYEVGYHVTPHVDVAWYGQTIANLVIPGGIDVKQSGVQLAMRF